MDKIFVNSLWLVIKSCSILAGIVFLLCFIIDEKPYTKILKILLVLIVIGFCLLGLRIIVLKYIDFANETLNA